MAKKKDDSPEIIKTEKPNPFAGINALSKWLCKSKKDYVEFQQICKHYGLDKQILKRIISYSYNNPTVLIYINKYMNELYDWNSYEFEDYIKSLVFVYSQNNLLNSKTFCYIKSSDYKDSDRTDVIKLFNEYFTSVYNEQFSDRVIRMYYELYLNGIISVSDILEADQLLHNGTKTLKIKEEVPLEKWEKQPELANISVADIIKKEQDDTETEISKFVKNIKLNKTTREKCKNCSLFSKPIVVLDTNVSDFSKPIDVVLMGLNPGTEEAKMDQPFTEKGKSGKYIRNRISQFPEGTSWVITNSILCSTKDKTDITDIKTVSSNCRELIDAILNKFNASLYVLIGADAMGVFNIEGNITKVSGTYYEDKKAIPVVHPSGIRGNPSKEAAERGWVEINKRVEMLKSKPEVIEDQESEVQTENESIKISENYMLFDVFELDKERILLTFIDAKGNKKTIIKENRMTSYIKDSDYMKCAITTKEVDAKFSYTPMEKFKLTKTLRAKLNDLKVIN